MKHATQLSTSTLALTILLATSASSSHATDIADRPLKASVLAKPNVIFGIDDSGSTDGEMLLDTSSGQLWWSGSTAWDSTKGRPLATNGTYDQMNYLFPMGLADGGKGGSIYQTSSVNSRHTPPTVQLAWVRSAKYNPQYYNPAVTYKPWSPGYVDSALRTYANASVTAAPAHPAISTSNTIDLTKQWDSTTAGSNWWADGFRFYVQKGMKLPVGTRGVANDGKSCSSSNTLTSIVDFNPTSSDTRCQVAIPYFPATYWHPENCGTTSNAEGSNCILGPDGTTKLKRYEIKSTTASYPSGRTYADEMQNFANWFSYYRKRKLSLGAAMGQVLENITGLRMGVLLFNSASTSTTPSAITMYDADAASNASNRLRVIGEHYKLRTAYNTSAPTPTHATMSHIGRQFHNNTNIIQFACQRNAMFIATDGFADASPSGLSVPSYSASTSQSNLPPYQTTLSKSLADLALAYFTVQARSDLPAGRVPLPPATGSNPDTNKNLHVNTYGLSLGARGTLWPSSVDPFVTAPTWPTPAATDPTMLDDLWHATINGRGQMYMADTPDETTAGIRAGLTDILSQTGAQGGIAVSTVNLPRGDTKAYFGTYNPAGWVGDLTANTINAETGSVSSTATWKAGDLLLARDWTTRIIATSSGGGANSAAVDFTAANVASVVNPASVYGADAAVINHLRGDRSGEGTLFRTRTGLMGAIINSEPVVSREDAVVYVASGEGMLHAFDTSSANPGRELWAFVPKEVLPNIGETVQRGYSFGTKLDGTPVLGKYSTTGKILVAGMGVAGRGYYALDVSNPRVSSANQLTVKWEFPSAADAAKVGQTLGRPVIVKSENNGYVVLVTSGYNNAADGPGRLWMLNADTGAVLKTFTTTGSTDSGLAHVAAFAEPPTGTVRYAYGGDLLGKVWRFDLSDPSATPTPKLLATLTGPTGAAQPITAAPELLWHKDTGQRVVLVGTGRLLDIGDFLSTNVQSIYAIADDATMLPLSTPRTTLAKQTYVRGATPNLDTLTGPSVDWSTNRGWFIDLPAREQINTRPTIAYGGLAFVSNSNSGASCDASSHLYVVDVLSGKKFAGTDFIGTVLSDTSNSSGVTALLTSRQKIVGAGQDGDGKPWSRDITAGSPINPSKNSWVEVRR